MGAGVPNWRKLYDMGKLPKGEEWRIPELNRKNVVAGKCSVEGCDFMASGTDGQKATRLKMHAKSHK